MVHSWGRRGNGGTVSAWRVAYADGNVCCRSRPRAIEGDGVHCRSKDARQMGHFGAASMAEEEDDCIKSSYAQRRQNE